MGKAIDVLAFDLGAESGRAVLGSFDGRRVELKPLHRFSNLPVRLLGSLHWNVLHLFEGMKQSIRKAVRQRSGELAGLGCDTWGVDFGLLDRVGGLLTLPVHYRDSRTDGVMEEAFRRISRREIFEETGIQFIKLNTLYQLLSVKLRNPSLLDQADCLLLMPGLFHYFLTGRKVAEFTNATTTQFYNPVKRAWASDLLKKLDLPAEILPEVVPPATVLGRLDVGVQRELGVGPIPVIAPACHDTGSAIAAVPGRGNDFAYLSSGTWSLMGSEIAEPLINAASLEHNFTNEGGAEGTFRFLKNLMGLWLLQECRRTWSERGEEYSYEELTRLAEGAPPFQAIVYVDDPGFFSPRDMPAALEEYAGRTGQDPGVFRDRGVVVRSILESLALHYRHVLGQLEEVLGKSLRVLHIVGGGSQNRLLNQMTADATGRPVVAGPVEATAVGNILLQLRALGEIGSLDELREIVRQSFTTATFEPRPTADWDEAFKRYQGLPRAS